MVITGIDPVMYVWYFVESAPGRTRETYPVGETVSRDATWAIPGRFKPSTPPTRMEGRLTPISGVSNLS